MAVGRGKETGQRSAVPVRILVADGDAEHRDLLVRNLRRLGTVDAVPDGEVALSAIASATPPDLVISDQRLLGMHGLDLLRRASARDPHVGRVLLTSYGDTGLNQGSHGGRVDAYLSKPCLPHQLRLTVAAVLDRVALSRENQRLIASVQEKNRALELALTSLRGAQGRLIDNERLAAIARTCAMVAHDFRGPLTVIRSGAGHLLRDDTSEPEQREIAEQMLAESVRMARMCEEMVAATRASGGTLQTQAVDLDALLGMSMAVVAEEAGLAGVEIRTELEADTELQLDADRIRRAILNITYNALEAMPSGGTFSARSERHEGFVRVSFSDTGPGIPDELRATAFEPFVTSGKRGGTGLGLAVVKKVVEDHGGRLVLDKADGGGALVRFDLPVSVR